MAAARRAARALQLASTGFQQVPFVLRQGMVGDQLVEEVNPMLRGVQVRTYEEIKLKLRAARGGLLVNLCVSSGKTGVALMAPFAMAAAGLPVGRQLYIVPNAEAAKGAPRRRPCPLLSSP